MIYLLDSDSLMAANRRYYRFKNFGCVWNWLEAKLKEKNVQSVDAVLEEIKKGDENDPLRQWAEKNHSHFVSTTDFDTQRAMNEITEYVDQNYSQNRLDEFLSKADGWLIAKSKALKNNGIQNAVVTNEQAVNNPSQDSKVKIPNVCNEFEIPTMNFFDFLSNLNANFETIFFFLEIWKR